MSPKRRKPARIEPARRSGPPARRSGPSKFAQFATRRGQGLRRGERIMLGGAVVLGVLALALVLVSVFGGGGPAPEELAITLQAATTQTAPQSSPTPRPPTVLSGNGARITETFLLQPGTVKVTMNHEGESSFAVRLEDAQGNPAGGAAGLGSELTNGVGAVTDQKSTTIATLGRYRLNVTADGPWQMILQQ